jgi:hypothetical protein
MPCVCPAITVGDAVVSRPKTAAVRNMISAFGMVCCDLVRTAAYCDVEQLGITA